MLLHRDDPYVKILRDQGEPLFLMDENPTAENISKLIYDYAASRGFPVVECQLWETPHCFATYRPS
jgi:6-pyruvoyltetrahydropterin/6-carboxytetrahydropterin synthase